MNNTDARLNSSTLKMLKLAVLIALTGVVLSAPNKDAELLEQQYVRDDHGQYSYNFLTSDGVARTEQGALVPNKEGTANVLVQRGGYRYLGADGKLVEVNYIADENGFTILDSKLPN